MKIYSASDPFVRATKKMSATQLQSEKGIIVHSYLPIYGFWHYVYNNAGRVQVVMYAVRKKTLAATL